MWLLLWILFGAGAAMIAANKGRSGLAWFFVGVLFGPFAILFALVAPANAAQLEQQAIAAGAMRKCPMCAELVKAEAVRCRFCGAELEPTANSPAAPAPLAAGEFYCARCRSDRPVTGSTTTIFGTRVCGTCAAVRT